MGKYIINVVDKYTMNVYVEAEAKEEAIKKAKYADLYRGDFKYVGRTCKLVEEKEN